MSIDVHGSPKRLSMQTSEKASGRPAGRQQRAWPGRRGSGKHAQSSKRSQHACCISESPTHPPVVRASARATSPRFVLRSERLFLRRCPIPWCRRVNVGGQHFVRSVETQQSPHGCSGGGVGHGAEGGIVHQRSGILFAFATKRLTHEMVAVQLQKRDTQTGGRDKQSASPTVQRAWVVHVHGRVLISYPPAHHPDPRPYSATAC